MLKFRFLSALFSAILIMGMSLESMALFVARNPREADIGILNQQQLNEKEADIAFQDTRLYIDDINIIKSGSRSRNTVNLVLRLDNNTFTEVSKGQDIGGWVLDLPKDMRAYVAEDVERGSQKLLVGLEGVSPRSMDDFIVVCIPSTVLVNKTENTVKTKYNARAGWEILSSDYEVINNEGEVVENEAEELTDTEVLAIKKQLVGELQGRAASYREVRIDTDKFISTSALEEIYDYALDAGKSERQLANVCLVLNEDDEDGRIASRMYVPFKNLVDAGNGINPVILKEQDHQRIEEISDAFTKQIGKSGQVISVENKPSFGSDVGVVVSLDGKISSNRYKRLYMYNEEEKTFEKFTGKYEVDAAGYLHFFTDAGGYFVLA